MAVLLNKIKATTLVETLVSLTIITCSAAVAILIFWQVSSPRSSVQSLMLAQQLSGEIMESITQKNDGQNFSGVIDVAGGLSFEQYTAEFSPGLEQVTIEVRDEHENIIYTRKRIFYVKAKETK